MWSFQLMGLLGTVPVVGAVAFLCKKRRLAVALFLSVPAKLILERRVIKKLVERERPGAFLPDAILRDASRTGLAFPSGHAILAFALAGLLSPYLSDKQRKVLWALALFNGIGRIYLGAHLPLDIVAGAGAGIGIGGALKLLLGVPASAKKEGQGESQNDPHTINTFDPSLKTKPSHVGR